MATEKQIQANIKNAEKAGVKSEDGRNTVRHNSFKHGLTSNSLISKLKSHKESKVEYLEIVEGLRSSLNPRNYFEEGLVEQMAKAQFKLKRFDALEASHFAEQRDTEPTFYSTIERNQAEWELYLRNSDQFHLFLKYKQSIEGQYYRALFALSQGRQAKQLDLFLPSSVEEDENALRPD